MPLSQAERMKRFDDAFGGLFPEAEWPKPKWRAVADRLQFREMAGGEIIMREGQTCGSVPFVVAGSIRVFKTAESGREITLYRIEAGETCILSSGCGKSLRSFPATVAAERDTVAAFLPVETVRVLLAEGTSFRDYVLDQYSSRILAVMELVEEVAFRHVDERLRQWLSEAAAQASGRRVLATHQGMADHLGTSREVVSRILKDWEQRGLLELGRGSIALKPAFDTAM